MGAWGSQNQEHVQRQQPSSGSAGRSAAPLDFREHPDVLSFYASVERKGWDTVDHILDDEESDDFLETAEGMETLAAGYLIAALVDQRMPSQAIAQRAVAKLRADRASMRELVTWARRARNGVSRVLGEDSQLRALAEASDDWQGWAAVVEELLDRLG